MRDPCAVAQTGSVLRKRARLITDLFKRHGGTTRVDARGEALQRAMMALVDGPGYTAPMARRRNLPCAPSVLGAIFSESV